MLKNGIGTAGSVKKLMKLLLSLNGLSAGFAVMGCGGPGKMVDDIGALVGSIGTGEGGANVGKGGGGGGGGTLVGKGGGRGGLNVEVVGGGGGGGGGGPNVGKGDGSVGMTLTVVLESE